MPVSASYLFVLLVAGKLFLLPLPAPPSSPVPSDSKPADLKLDESALPLPGPDVPSVPASPSEGKIGAIVEEPAPPPQEQPAGPISILSPQPVREEAATIPQEQVPPSAPPGAPRDPSLPDVEALHCEIESLRLERESMLVEKTDLSTAKDLHAAKGDEVSLQKRVAELLIRIVGQAKKAKETASASPPQRAQSEAVRVEAKSNPSPTAHPPVLPAPSPPSPSPTASVNQPDDAAKVVADAPVDPLALAQSLFRSGDYAAALNVYRKLDKDDHKSEQRVTTQYMMACCLRKLGKIDEASALYQQVANSPGSDFLAENARWYLQTMKERREMQVQLDALRQRRQAMTPRKL